MALQALQQHFMARLLANEEEAKGGMAIYRNNNREGLIKALANLYPVCSRLVGISCFRAMAHHYIQRYPSRSPNLNDYGEYFSSWVLEMPFHDNLPYLSEVAQLEWIIHTILMDFPTSMVDWNSLAKLTLEQQSTLVLHRANNSVLVHFQYPVDRIWEVNQNESLSEEIIDLSESEVFLMVWRTEVDLKLNRLTLAEWTLLNQIALKKSLEQLATITPSQIEGVDFLTVLSGLIKKGCITSFSI